MHAPQALSRALVVPADAVARLSAGQLSVVEAVSKGRHVFLTGRAGCGKTEAIQALMDTLKRAGVLFAVTASTGIAAEPLRGSTLHALLCLNDSSETEACVRRLRKLSGKLKTATSIQVLIVDEVSMLSEQTLGQALAVLKLVRGSLPVLVMAGDFLQLPPVKAPPLLGSSLWEALDPEVICLQDNFRQRDDSRFGALLDECRYGALSEASVMLLEGRLDAPFPDDAPVTEIHAHRESARRINAEKLGALPGPVYMYTAHIFFGSDVRSEDHVPEFGKGRVGEDGACSDGEDFDFEDFPEYVRRSELDEYWQVNVSDMPPSEPLWFWAKDARACKPVPPAPLVRDPSWEGVCVDLPPVADVWITAEKMVQDTLMVPSLKLAVGALVMFTANISPPFIVNGSQGVVVEFHHSGRPVVRLLRTGERVVVNPWPVARRVIPERDMPCVVMAQLPLQLAWAITIHKSQGQTLDRARVNLGSSIFEKSQAYVAVSRVRTLEGLSLIAFRPSSVSANQDIVQWYKTQESKMRMGAGV
jgi:ATP-dependent DNA helicase PIF1